MSACTGEKTEFTVSLALGGGRRQEVIIGRNTTWNQFKQQVHLAYGLPTGAVTYIDEEGDSVSLDSEIEFKEAVKVGFKLGKLKLNIADNKAQYSSRIHKRSSTKGRHYSDLARTLGEEKTKAVVTTTDTVEKQPSQEAFTDSPVRPSSPDPNPYISNFLRSMSQQDKKPSNGTTKHLPADSKENTSSTHHHASPQEREGSTAVKRRRVNEHSTANTTRGYRRAFRQTAPAEHVEGVRKNMGEMKISQGEEDNPLVDRLAQKLQECYDRRGNEPMELSSSCPTKLNDKEFDNQYIVRYQQNLLKTRRVCQASRPNKYVAKIHRSLSENHISKKHHHRHTHRRTVPNTNKECSIADLPANTGPVHCGVTCDSCQSQIVGVRYKCGHCRNFDLCENCEKRGDRIHSPGHIFLKVKVPCLSLGRDAAGNMQPLLPYLYPPSEDQIPLLTSEDYSCSGYGMIVRPKDKLREEIKAAKKRRKEEKRRHQVEERGKESVDPHKLRAKLEKLQITSHHNETTSEKKRTEFVMPRVTFEKQAATGVTTTNEHTHKPTKFLGCKVVTETCCPQGSSISPGVPFEKGWILRNSGTKKWKKTSLVHQGGYRPCHTEVSIPEIKPGQSVEVKVQYPAVNSGDDIQIIESSWCLVYKESTAFGPPLTVSVVVETPQAKTTPTAMPPLVQPLTSLTNNEDLLKSIGFLPTDNVPTPPEYIHSYPTDFELIPAGEPGEISTSNVPQVGPSGGFDTEIPPFVMVENPCSEVMSLASNDSLHQTPSSVPPLHIDSDDDKDSVVASDGSDSEEDFVVVIPDCFNLELPLSTTNPPMSHDFMTRSCDYLDHMTLDNTNDVMVQSHDSIMSPTPITSNPVPIPPQVTFPDFNTTTPNQPEQQTPPTNTTSTHQVPSTSPRTGRRPFVPERVTLRGVKDARIRNPLTVATGIVNTVSDLVEGLTLPNKKRGGSTVEKDTAGKQDVTTTTTTGKEDAPVINDNQERPQNSPEEDEEMFVDCPQYPEPSAPLPHTTHSPSPPPSDTTEFSSWQQCLPDNVTSWLQSDATQFVRSDSQNDEVLEMVDRQWKSPDVPDDPIEKLVTMGFANRELNKRLLQKHNYQLQAVTNELLDLQNSGDSHWASNRH